MTKTKLEDKSPEITVSAVRFTELETKGKIYDLMRDVLRLQREIAGKQLEINALEASLAAKHDEK